MRRLGLSLAALVIVLINFGGLLEPYSVKRESQTDSGRVRKLV